MKRSSAERIRLIVRKVARRYGISRELIFDLDKAPAQMSEVPLHMEEVTDEEGKLQGFRIRIFDETVSKNELEAILQHELAHARLQSMGFLRVTGSLPLKLSPGSKPELEAVNSMVGFPWEYYSSILHAKYFPKSFRQMADQYMDSFKAKPGEGWTGLERLLRLLIWRRVSEAMAWADLEGKLSELISAHTDERNRAKVDALALALDGMPELPELVFETTPLRTVLRIMVEALNDVFKEILERPLDVPTGLPARPTYIA